MRYRVIRDLGSSDYVIGAVFDGAALPERRLRLLTEQHKIEPVADPGDGFAQIRAWQAEQEAAVADLKTSVEGLASERDDLLNAIDAAKTERDALAAELESAKAQLGVVGPLDSPADEPVTEAVSGEDVAYGASPAADVAPTTTGRARRGGQKE